MDLLFAEAMGKPLWMWLVFLTFVLALLTFDLGVLHRKSHEIGVRESLKMSSFYIGLGIAFSGWIWHRLGEDAAFDYLTGFVLEQRSEEHTSELQSLMRNSYAVFCLKKKN